MTTHSTLEVRWSGSVPGLVEHRLSLDAFGQALPLLLAAYRRIASNMLRDAADRYTKPDKRLFKRASWLDLQLQDVTRGSAGVSALGVLEPPAGQQAELFNTLATRAGVELLDAIEAESSGELRSSAVRKYLAALPPGVTGQEYCFSSNGTKKTISIGALHLPEDEGELPYFLETVGTVVSVGFDPGEPFVKVETEDGATISCRAKSEDVDRAIELRGQPVTVFAVYSDSLKGRRLLNIRPAGEPVEKLTPDELEHNVFGKWDELLRRLAQ